MGRNEVKTTVGSGLGTLQFANGVTKCKGAKGRAEPLVGWHSEIGVDESLDAACEAQAVGRVTILHQREGAPPESKEHWFFGETVYIVPITTGPRSDGIKGMVKKSRESIQDGIFVAWPQGGRSQMKIWVILAGRADAPTEFFDHGTIMMQMGARSTMTGYLLASLIDHNNYLNWVDKQPQRSGLPIADYWHCLLPLESGEEISVGTAAATTITPYRSAHPAEPNGAYLLAHLISDDLALFIKDTLFPQVVNYAQSALDALNERDAANAPQDY